MDFAAQYKIRISPIGLAGHPAITYKMKVNQHLNLIYGTKVGRILFDCIRFHGLPVDISPYTGVGCNSGGGWTTAAGTRQGFATYSPDTFAPHGACSAALGTSGRLGHEILFHELVHAFRGVSGKWNKVALGLNMSRYTDSEEFLAVMLTNIFISDGSNKKKSSLRADHTDYQSLAPDFVAPFSFFESSTLVLPLVKKFVEENHGLAIMLAHSHAPFNPIADYVASSDKAELSSKKAVPRDLASVGVELSRWVLSVFH